MSFWIQVYVNIKDAVVNFFHAQGITIVTIQPEFKTKSTGAIKEKSTIAECLIGCQSIECAPKTCCSTTDLHEILANGDGTKQRKHKKDKTGRKSSSMLSLNVTSLVKLRILTGSTQDIIKKSASESHMTQINSDDSSSDSQNTSTNVSTTLSTSNNLYATHNSIDELKEKEFHEQCGERSEQRLPPAEKHPRSRQIESISEHEDSSLLNRSIDSEKQHNHQKCMVDSEAEAQPRQEKPWYYYLLNTYILQFSHLFKCQC